MTSYYQYQYLYNTLFVKCFELELRISEQELNIHADINSSIAIAQFSVFKLSGGPLSMNDKILYISVHISEFICFVVKIKQTTYQHTRNRNIDIDSIIEVAKLTVWKLIRGPLILNIQVFSIALYFISALNSSL